MSKNIWFVILSLIVLFLLLYILFRKPNEVIKLNTVIRTDTVLVHDTLYMENSKQNTNIPGLNKPFHKDLSKNQSRENPYAKANFTINIFTSESNTFGYDIMMNGKPMIHQPSIPGMSGNAGFKTKEFAMKVAGIVVNKIKNNQMPPGLTVQELNNLGVLK